MARNSKTALDMFHPGVVSALVAAALFGASTPLAKALLGRIEPLMLAGLLYLGSGVCLTLWLGLRRLAPIGGRSTEAGLTRADVPWLAGAIFSGGVVGPALLVYGLVATAASTASLLLNLEGVFTALLAWFVFRENFDRRIVAGMICIAAGGALLSWSGRPEAGIPWGPLAVAGACLAWAWDNNLTRKVSASDPVRIAALKGVAAGSVNVALALTLGQRFPGAEAAVGAAAIGLFGYGISLALFVRALRDVGAARSGAYFSMAPFFGAALSIALLGDRVSPAFAGAAALMAAGLWLHLTETHEHAHRHEWLEHDHAHRHDDGHHGHEHAPGVNPREPHSHPHAHPPTEHAHPHFPDIHHQHEHA